MDKFYYRVLKTAPRPKSSPSHTVEKFPRTFREFFHGPDLWADEALWEAFLLWRQRQEATDYAKFRNDFLKSRENAKKQVEDWPNPLPNGKKGEEYSVTFRLPDCVERYKFINLEAASLKESHAPGDPLLCTISGSPRQAGEYEVTLAYTWRGFRKKNEHLTKKLKININPDPREMWKNIPTDRRIEYYKTDEDSEKLACHGRNMLAASIRGRSHAHTGAPRDDDFELECHGGWSILCVADGAGSAPFSREGSRIACTTAVEACAIQLAANTGMEAFLAGISSNMPAAQWQPQAKKIAYNILPHAALEAHKAIREEAKKLGREPKSYATTLLLALAKKFPGGWIVMSFQVGDGAIALLRNDGSGLDSILLAEPDEGEFGGQTRFITMKEIFDAQGLMQRLRVEFTPSLEALLLMSDGVSDAYFATLANLQDKRFWRNLWTQLKPVTQGREAPADLLKWLQFWSQGNHDDRTIAILY